MSAAPVRVLLVYRPNLACPLCDLDMCSHRADSTEIVDGITFAIFMENNATNL